MKEVSEAANSREKSGPSAVACIAFAGLSLLLLLPALFFSLGPLITTWGRAWEYEPVRELFIISTAMFILLVVAPLVYAFWSSRRKGAV